MRTPLGIDIDDEVRIIHQQTFLLLLAGYHIGHPCRATIVDRRSYVWRDYPYCKVRAFRELKHDRAMAERA